MASAGFVARTSCRVGVWLVGYLVHCQMLCAVYSLFTAGVWPAPVSQSDSAAGRDVTRRCSCPGCCRRRQRAWTFQCRRHCTGRQWVTAYVVANFCYYTRLTALFQDNLGRLVPERYHQSGFIWGKRRWGFGMQWQQLDHMQTIFTLLHSDNHTNRSLLSYYRLFAHAQPTALKAVVVNFVFNSVTSREE